MSYIQSFPSFQPLETAVSTLGNARSHQWKRFTQPLVWKFMDV